MKQPGARCAACALGSTSPRHVVACVRMDVTSCHYCSKYLTSVCVNMFAWVYVYCLYAGVRGGHGVSDTHATPVIRLWTTGWREWVWTQVLCKSSNIHRGILPVLRFLFWTTWFWYNLLGRLLEAVDRLVTTGAVFCFLFIPVFRTTHLVQRGSLPLLLILCGISCSLEVAM